MEQLPKENFPEASILEANFERFKNIMKKIESSGIFVDLERPTGNMSWRAAGLKFKDGEIFKGKLIPEEQYEALESEVRLMENQKKHLSESDQKEVDDLLIRAKLYLSAHNPPEYYKDEHYKEKIE